MRHHDGPSLRERRDRLGSAWSTDSQHGEQTTRSTGTEEGERNQLSSAAD